ncbi:MAG: septal ring lytic transglycosylase RlpA family protein [Symploca sp. SIO1B1]|nr:septal ring lytic transglycosylase RlpA family protein [Symploca sp. SIO1B1]
MEKLQAEGVTCAVIDLTEIGSREVKAEQWYGSLIKLISKDLELATRFNFNFKNWLSTREIIFPGQRFTEFIEEVLLTKITDNIVIFIDEIDQVINLDFKDDFFALIRSFYNKRAEKSVYRRLTFALLGVATPYELVGDSIRTPFNIGKSIPLNGFQLQKIKPLSEGLREKASNPQAVLQAVLYWTNGQPFLTQKLCQLVLDNYDYIKEGEEEKTIEYLVGTKVVAHWELQDNPEHLRTIRNNMLRSETSAPQFLELYQRILQQGKIVFDNSEMQIKLQLSGLIINKSNKHLIISNPIYESIFNQNWISESLRNLRPHYAEKISAWIESNYQDKSSLLQGYKLQYVEKWSEGKNLSPQDNQFLEESKRLATQQKNIKKLTIVTVVLFFLSFLASISTAFNRYQHSQTLEEKINFLEEDLAATEEDLVDSEKDLASLIQDQVKESSDAYYQSINRIEQVKESDRKERLYRKTGRTLFANQEYSRVIEVYERSYELAKNNNSKEGIIESLYYLGHAYKALGNEEKAQEYFQKGEKELLSSYYSQYLTQGTASFSSFDEEGQLTASLEKFDPTEKTAAHRDLPFGTRVRVTNPKTDLSVVVRINNRGPARKTGRIINLSQSAAQEIGLTKKEGIIRVQLEAAGD